MHTMGVRDGGDARIGARTLFLGGITVGNLNNRAIRLGKTLLFGAGARILGRWWSARAP